MIFGGTAVGVAAADRQGTESIAAAVAWGICLFTTVAFRWGKYQLSNCSHTKSEPKVSTVGQLLMLHRTRCLTRVFQMAYSTVAIKT